MEEEEKFRGLFGELISKARLEKGLTQKELGVRIGYTENSAGQVIHKIEEGKIDVPKKKIATLLDILGITHEQLGVDQSVSLPLWIATRGKKGSGMSFKDFISTAESIVTGVAEISETVASGIMEISETIVSGISMGVSQLEKGAAILSMAEGERERIYKLSIKFVKLMILRDRAKERLTDLEKKEVVNVLCEGDTEKRDAVLKILRL